MKVLCLVPGAASEGLVTAMLDTLTQRGIAVRLVADLQDDASVRLVHRLGSGDSAGTPPPVLPFEPKAIIAGECLRHSDCRAHDEPTSPVLDALPPWLMKSTAGEWLLRRAARSVPRDPGAEAFLRGEAPDRLLVLPWTTPGSLHADYVRTAVALGIPTTCPASADELARWLDVPLARRGPEERSVLWGLAARLLLRRPAVRLAASAFGRGLKEARRACAGRQRALAKAARKAELPAARLRADMQRAARRHEEVVRRGAARIEQEAETDRAYRDYVRVREWARQVSGVGAAVTLTDVEQRLTERLAPMWAADRGTIATLRRRASWLGGAPATDYEPPSETLSACLLSELRILRKKVGLDVPVQEPRILGAFGVARRREFYNQDTITFLKALAALKNGEVLTPIRTGRRRHVIWEIGGGWGGFAYQFKTMCPNVTYMITGRPDAMLMSAVYLMSAFPDARVRFYGEDEPRVRWDDADEIDFLFAPESVLPDIRPPRLDLVLDLAALKDMTTTRVACHMKHAFDCGGTYVYSMMPGSHSLEAAEIWKQVERWYWVHPVPPLRTAEISYPPDPAEHVDFAHIVGWKRIRA